MASGTPGSHCSITLLLIIFVASAFQANSRTFHEATMYTKHKQWMALHERVYESSQEKERRFKIFKTNIEFIENFNQAGNHTYTLGTNKFTDLTAEEFMASHTGNMMPYSSTMYNSTFTYQNANDAPPAKDWRDERAVTDVKDQRECGSCWAFSAVAAAEVLHRINTGELISLSEQEILDCDGESTGCNGNSIEHAFEFIRNNQGLNNDAAYPYMAEEGTCSKTSQSYGAISGYERVPPNDEESLRKAVASQPVSVGVDPMFFQHYSGGIISDECGTNLRHAVTIVGYGTSDNGMKYWICKNSWGTTWGDGGYVMIQRDSGVEGGMCGIAMEAMYPSP